MRLELVLSTGGDPVVIEKANYGLVTEFATLLRYQGMRPHHHDSVAAILREKVCQAEENGQLPVAGQELPQPMLGLQNLLTALETKPEAWIESMVSE